MNLVRIRKLNAEGIDKFREFLGSFAEVPTRSVDFQSELWPILTGLDTTSHVPNIVQLDADLTYRRRYDLAECLHGLVPQLGLADPTREPGLWAWLAMLWFPQLAPIEGGSRKVGEKAKWLPEGGWKYYRHVVLGPYLIYSTNQDCPQRALALLHNPPHTPGELVGQLAATQDVAQSKAAIGVATRLYYDVERGTMRKGAGGSGRGSPRRFRTVLNQLDRTYDIQSLTEDGLYALLPDEFKGGRGRKK